MSVRRMSSTRGEGTVATTSPRGEQALTGLAPCGELGCLHVFEHREERDYSNRSSPRAATEAVCMESELPR